MTLTTALSTATAPVDIPLRIIDPPSAGYTLALGGVPFAAGEVADIEALTITRNGEPVPARTEAMNLYPDGSVRWALLEFAVGGAENHDAYALKTTTGNGEPEAIGGVAVEEASHGFLVGNNRIRFKVNAEKFSPFEELQMREATDKPWKTFLNRMDLSVADWYPRIHTASSADSSPTVTIEQQHPLHTIIRYHGVFMKTYLNDTPRLDYDIRLHVYADSPSILVDIVLAQVSDDAWMAFRGIDVDLLPVETVDEVTFGGSTQPCRLDASPSWRQTQTGPTHYQPWKPFEWNIRDASNESFSQGEKAPGWASYTSGDQELTVALQEFAEKHASGFQVTPERFSVALWPRDAEPFVFPRGAAIRRQFLLNLASKTRPSTPEALVEQVNRPLRITVEPERYIASGVFGPILSASETPGDYDAILLNQLQEVVERRETERLFGLLDYGDYPFYAESDEWTNLEYDLPHGCFVHFARTGNRLYLDEGLVDARHRMDIDVIRHDPDPLSIGVNAKHHTGHVGRRDGMTGSAKVLLDHTWHESFWEYYFLTGDRHARDVAELAAQALMNATAEPIDGKRERNYGWAIIALLSTYRATLDDAVLARIDRLIDDAIRQQNPDGSFLSSDCNGVRINGNKPFMMGILMDAMVQAHEYLPDPKIEEFITGAASWLERMWVDDSDGFAYSVCDMDRGRPQDNRELMGLWFAWKLTGNNSYLDMAECNFSAGLRLRAEDASESSKDVAIFMRATPHFMALHEQEKSSANQAD